MDDGRTPAPAPAGTPVTVRVRGNRWELISCALRGHVLVGTDAARVSAADRLVVRPGGGVRWHRCLRCDGWFARPAPSTPARPTVPGRDEVEVPLRGPLLRDRYVLRLIAVERGLHVLVSAGLALAVFFVAGHRTSLQADYTRVLNDFYGASAGNASSHGLLGTVRHFFFVSPTHLYEVAGVLLAYAAIESVEMVGLWFAQRWAEYLTFVVTAAFIPFEVYEIATKASVFKVLTLVANLAIAAYLLWAKRLFGVRGGGAAEAERKRTGTGWAALERADAAS